MGRWLYSGVFYSTRANSPRVGERVSPEGHVGTLTTAVRCLVSPLDLH